MLAALTSIRHGRRCESSPICSLGPAARCRSGTRFRSAAITFAKRDRPRFRKWRSRSPTRSLMCEAAIDAGLGRGCVRAAPRFFFNAHNNFLEEIAKFRAARRAMGEHHARTLSCANDPRRWMMRFHAQTAGSTLTAQQPDNNVVRVAIQAMAAVLGGTQSLHTNARDEALSLPTERCRADRTPDAADHRRTKAESLPCRSAWRQRVH